MSRLISQGRKLEKAKEDDPAAPPVSSSPVPESRVPRARAEVGAEVIERLARTMPRPSEEVTENLPATLDEREQRDLALCEAALDHLRVAFWIAGRALEVIQKARLYRETHATFEEYCAERWGMSRQHAYRLIREWSLAERLMILSPIGDKIKIGESHVRELLPVKDTHSEEAAEVVFRTVAESDVKVTAELLRQVVGVLPDGEFDREAAVAEIRAFLARGGETVDDEEAPAAAPSRWSARATRVRATLEQLAVRPSRKSTVQAEEVRRFVTESRALLDQIEQTLLADD
ncbi:hypothetical protein GCM10020216_039470 [Nonomuraea helvata]